jgi:hypothetical protein
MRLRIFGGGPKTPQSPMPSKSSCLLLLSTRACLDWARRPAYASKWIRFAPRGRAAADGGGQRGGEKGTTPNRKKRYAERPQSPSAPTPATARHSVLDAEQICLFAVATCLSYQCTYLQSTEGPALATRSSVPSKSACLLLLSTCPIYVPTCSPQQACGAAAVVPAGETAGHAGLLGLPVAACISYDPGLGGVGHVKGP